MATKYGVKIILLSRFYYQTKKTVTYKLKTMKMLTQKTQRIQAMKLTKVIKKMKSLFESNKEKGIVCWITFLSTLLFPILSIELFSGINTHIWTGIIFGFLLSLIIEKKTTSS